MNKGTQLNILNFAVLAYDCGNYEFFNDMIEWLIKERSPLVEQIYPDQFYTGEGQFLNPDLITKQKNVLLEAVKKMKPEGFCDADPGFYATKSGRIRPRGKPERRWDRK